jgi:hypothetical protein
MLCWRFLVPHDLMTQCEQKKRFMVGDKIEWKWIRVPVSRVVGTSYEAIRCVHCHGAVRLHQRQVEHGPKDHVEHRSRQDSEHCKGGVYFDGEHRTSSQPVV